MYTVLHKDHADVYRFFIEGVEKSYWMHGEILIVYSGHNMSELLLQYKSYNCLCCVYKFLSLYCQDNLLFDACIDTVNLCPNKTSPFNNFCSTRSIKK